MRCAGARGTGQGSLRNKSELLRRVLRGELRAHHKLILAQLLADIDFLDKEIAEVGAGIARRLEEKQDALHRLDAIPGINARIGEVILAKRGTDMSRFPSESHLSS